MSAITEPVMLDRTGQAIKEAVLSIASAIEAKSGVIYAFHVDGEEGNPESKITYLKDAVGMKPAKMDYSAGKFDYGSWEDAFFMPRPCMVKYDGTVDYYLDPNDYSKRLDGSASDVANTSYGGNAMMEWGRDGKKIWMKIVPDVGDSSSATVYIANYQVDFTYHDWPFHNCKGVSVDHFYTPIYNGSSINDGTNDVMRSLSGQAVSKTKNAETELTMAKRNNKTADEIWSTENYADIVLINALLILMGKTTDTQAAFGKGLIDSGSEAINDAFRTGVHNAKGLFYGTNTGAAATYTNAVKVFGMENWWGFQWRRYHGHVMVAGSQKVKLTYGMEDGSSVAGYNLTGANYLTIGAQPTGTSGQYCDKWEYSPNGMVPKNADNTKATASTHYCDGFWFNNADTRVPCRGGASYSGADCGAFSVLLTAAASVAWWDVGAALSCKPLT